MKIFLLKALKRKGILLMCLFLSSHQMLSAQQKLELPQSVIRDYALNMYREFSWGKDALRAMIFLSLRSQGYSDGDILRGMEKLDINKDFRKSTYRAWYRRVGGSGNFLMINLTSIGMSAQNASILSNYIIGFHNRENKEEEKKEQENNYNNAKQQYQKLIVDYKKGKLVEGDKLGLIDYIPNISLLNVDEQLHIKAEKFNVEYQKDSILIFLSRYFENGAIYLKISKDGELVSIENKDASISLNTKDMPQLKKLVQVSGRFMLEINDEVIPVNYKFPALSYKKGSCSITNTYYFSFDKNDISFVKDSLDVKNKTPKIRYSTKCPTNTLFIFEKDEIKKLIYTYLNVASVKEIKKISNTTSKAGSNILKVGLTIATGIPLAGTETERNENLFKFIKKINREVFYLWDLTDTNSLSITDYKILNTEYTFEVYDPKEKQFTEIKPKE